MAVRPACPRCGYDLDGLIAAWTESCPMRAVCSECGLDFDCSRALSPRLIGPPWCYEHGFVRSRRRWWATSLMALFPRRLFRELAVDHQVRPGRLVRFGLMWLAAIHVFTGVICALVTMVALGGPGMFGRSMVLLEPGFWAWIGPRLLIPYAYEVAIPTGAATSVRIPLAPAFLLIGIPTVLMPLWMTILSGSFRQARLRQVQVLRGTAYSLGCAALYVLLFLVTVIGATWISAYLNTGIIFAALPVMFFFCIGHHLYWWFMFIRRYLRLRHGAAIVGLYSVMNVLVIAIVFVLLVARGVRW